MCCLCDDPQSPYPPPSTLNTEPDSEPEPHEETQQQKQHDFHDHAVSSILDSSGMDLAREREEQGTQKKRQERISKDLGVQFYNSQIIQ
jgi:hypothetical protein